MKEREIDSLRCRRLNSTGDVNIIVDFLLAEHFLDDEDFPEIGDGVGDGERGTVLSLL